MPYNIIYVEDQPEMIELVQLALRRLDCSVHGATDGRQALELMRSEHPDLVLLDLMLPGCDGWQIVQAMQADTGLKHLPVILITARSANASAGRQPPQADAFITKPFAVEELRQAVGSVLNNLRS
jgi:CheY-like chemotaxis protein